MPIYMKYDGIDGDVTAEGHEKPFVSGYSNRLLPNLWDLSKEPLQ